MELKSYKEHRNIISEIVPGSIADELGLKPGDEILSVNGNKIRDIIDYKFYINDFHILLGIKKKDGSLWEFDIEKDYNEDLGVDFTNPLIDRAKRCSNNCIFCFIDQLPPGMRETLYFKDDDSRLSFLQGNFITLTNMKEEDIDRIIKYRIAPVNISIHTTNPDLRVKLLKNKNSGKVLNYLKKFKEAGLEIQGQIVLVPGYNDGKELDRTIRDLTDLYPTLISLAIVPVGLTKYRDQLPDLRVFTKEEAKEVIRQVEGYQQRALKEYGTRLVYLSDEFYITAEEPIPEEYRYEGYPQIENGVGMVRSFREEFLKALPDLSPSDNIKKNILLGTGKLAAPLMNTIAGELGACFPNSKFHLAEIKNNFFGETITVSGLLTGRDVIAQLKEISSDVIMLPKNMMRNYEPVTLDDYRQEELEKALGRKIYFGSWDGYEFVDTIRQVMADE